jgi:Amidase
MNWERCLSYALMFLKHSWCWPKYFKMLPRRLTVVQWGETYNNVFGRTANPFNRSLTAGGSSGGEGALIGLHGSPLGVGSDSESSAYTSSPQSITILFSMSRKVGG